MWFYEKNVFGNRKFGKILTSRLLFFREMPEVVKVRN
jgi:hypothetical protein